MKNILLSLALLVGHSIFSQSYDLAAGIRLGSELGLSVMMRVPPVDKNFTGEFIVQQDFDGEEVLMTLLAAQHMPIITRRLNLYTGMGLHKGWLDQDIKEIESKQNPFGVSFIGGVEIDFKRFNISVDYKPVVNITGGDKVFQSSSALTVRYIPFKRYDIFNSPKERRQKQRQKKRDEKAKGRASKSKKWYEVWKKA